MMSLDFHRYMDAAEFARELKKLHAFRGAYFDTGLLESLEEAGLLFPRIRIRYPDPVARRFWLETHARQLKHSVEPDGPRWESAVELSNRLYRWRNHTAYGASFHPLDDLEPRFAEFIQSPSATVFEAWLDMRVDVSNEVEPLLFDGHNFDSYYSTWQLLQAAEVADAGIHFRLNLANEAVARRADEAIRNGTVPADNPSFNLMPVHVMRDFAKHENGLNAVVWYAEESDRALMEIVKAQGGGRFQLSKEQNERYRIESGEATQDSARRHGIGTDDLVLLCRFLSARWLDWDRGGRPLIAEAYKDMLGKTVQMAKQFGGLKYIEVRDLVGQVGGWFKPILDVIWPSWIEQETDRVRLALNASIKSKNIEGLIEADINAFAGFLAKEGLEGFFWRLKSFEDHVFRGNEFALEGMKSDLQGMAVAVEHVVAALGGTETQLYEKFKQVWKNPEVLAILKRGDVSPLARQERLAQDWPDLKARIDALRNEAGGIIAADLVMAHRIRGGVHTILPEDDQFELEALFLALMRAAVLTFVEVRRIENLSKQTGAPTLAPCAVATAN
jgi:hypothetical protein